MNKMICVLIMFLSISAGFAKWEDVPSGTTNNLNSVCFVNQSFGIIAGNNGTILKTNDGGANWQPRSSVLTGNLNNVFFIDENNGWIVGDNGSSGIRTNDAGETWSLMDIPVSENLNSVFFYNENLGWAVGNAGSVFLTTDGGENWNQQNVGVTDSFYDVCFVNQDLGWIVGENGIIMISNNGGYTWSVQQGGMNIQLNQMFFSDASNGYICGNSGALLKTMDGGNSWETVITDYNNDFLSISGFLNKNLLLCADDGVIIKSTDSGNNWTQENSGVTNILNSIFCKSSDLMIAVGDNGKIIKYSVPISNTTIEEVTIGNQTWMKKNLDVAYYRNGDPIPQVTDPTQWVNLTTGAWCYYNNDPATDEVYGKLYNWAAMSDPRGLAPEGWHIPSDEEWKTLEMHLGMSKQDADVIGFRGGANNVGGKLKETSFSKWQSPNTNATNESGFTALPSGYRICYTGEFYYQKYGVSFPTSTEYSDKHLWARHLSYISGSIYRHANPEGDELCTKNSGWPVRCIKDNINLQSGLVAYYPFNGNANDESGNGNHGTNNGATLTTDRFGNANSAYYFDGVNDYINANIGSYQQITFSVWYNRDIQEVDYPTMVCYDASQGMYLHDLGVTYSQWGQVGLVLAGVFNNNIIVNGHGDGCGAYTGYVPEYNNWHHLTASYDGQILKLYVNGQYINSCNYTMQLNAVDILIGGKIYGGSLWNTLFKGLIDDIRIYNRALNEAEVAALYNDNYSYIISPTLGETVTTQEIDFEWTDVGADHYELIVDNNAGFSSPEVAARHRPHMADLDNLTSTTYTLCGNWLPQNVYHVKVISYFSSGTITESTSSFTYMPERSLDPLWHPIYRCYKPNDRDHFYCTNETHKQTAINSGYKFEGTEGFVSIIPFFPEHEQVCIYRFYKVDESSHYYTTDDTERDELIAASEDNIYEGIMGYTSNTYSFGFVKMYHLSKSESSTVTDNFYTTSPYERDYAVNKFGYDYFPDAGFYVSAFSDLYPNPQWNAFFSSVNPFNGNFNNVTNSNFNIPSGGFDLNFSHSYNSLSNFLHTAVKPLGTGWNHSYNINMEVLEQIIYVYWSSGSVDTYENPNLAGSSTVTCQTPKGVYDILTKVSNSVYTIKTKNQLIYRFEIPGSGEIAYLKSITDRNNNQLLFVYDGFQRLTTVTQVNTGGTNRSLTFYYHDDDDKHKLVKEVKDNINRTVQYFYDDNLNMNRFVDAMGQETQYFYEGNDPEKHLMTQIILPNSSTITNGYDLETFKATSQTVDGKTVNYDYSIPSEATIRLPDSETTVVLNYNSSADPMLASITDPKNNVVSILYENANDPTLPTRLTDAMGNSSTISYDDQGNTTQVNLPYGIVHKYFYTSINDIAKYENPLGINTYYRYDANGNLNELETALGTSKMYYNPNGTVSRTEDALLRRVDFTYNNYWNVSSVTDMLGNTTNFTYDAVSRLTQVRDPNGNSSTFTYNNNDKTTNVKNALTYSTGYNYNLLDQLTSVVDPKGNSTSLAYNSSNLLESITNQLGKSRSYEYDIMGRNRKINNPSGKDVEFTYDLSGQIKTVSYSSKTVTYDYNNNGMLTKVSDENGNINFTQYDSLSRLLEYTDFYGNTVRYEYDKNSRITAIVYPGNKRVTYEYYDYDLLRWVEDWNGRRTTYYYNVDGSLSYRTNANGTKTEFVYDAAGRLTRQTTKKSNNVIIADETYTLDNTGNHTAVNKNLPLMAYPPTGNMKNYTYNNANRIETAGTVNYEFDDDGNCTRRNGSTITNYSYDALNRLQTVTGTNNASYIYDALGHRRAATRTGVTRRYVLDINSGLDKILMETDDSGNPINYYIYGYGLVSRVKADNTTHYYHYDARGSTVAMTDMSENISHSYSYDVYGAILSQNVPAGDDNLFKYVAAYGVMDEGNGLHYMRARYYDAEIGRFLSEDPIWATNSYWYADGNPVMGIDPKGLWSLPNHKSITEEALNALGIKDAEVIKRIVNGNEDSDNKTLGTRRGLIPLLHNYNRHALRTPGQNEDEARSEWDKIVMDELTLFITTGELEALGRALHSIQDAENPGHAFSGGPRIDNYKYIKNDLINHYNKDNYGSHTSYYRNAVEKSRLFAQKAIEYRRRYIENK